MFTRRLEEALEWISTEGRYRMEEQQREVTDLFREAKSLYARWAETTA